MTDAPEKIWAYAGTFKMWRGHKTDHPQDVQTEYTRTDVADARIAELEAALIGVLPYVSASREDAECACMERFDRPIGNTVSIARAALENKP
tara:strand:- start:2674 stop:2949 length:276 start_codon:yes stop_codon:yes gene_type:complete